MNDTYEAYDLIVKDGLRRFKFKNSQSPAEAAQEETKGSIFGYRSKEDMIHAKGIIMTSIEAVKENSSRLTHWTPNVYRFGAYVDDNRQITRGHAEGNLRQINTFVVDFDIHSEAEAITQSDILTASIDLGFMPTLILQSQRGYQAYFILKSPAYVTAQSNFKVLKVAKEISQNLRLYFKQTLPVDMTCNHFGIARLPRKDNVVFYHTDYSYSFEEWLSWSMKQSEFSLQTKRPNLDVIVGTQGAKQIDESWYDLLLNSSQIKGEKALMGRNSVLFTLALANYASGIDQSVCETALERFNSNLVQPLDRKEFLKTVSSAYSGKYEAASRDYVILLCEEWVSSSLTKKDLFIRQGWTKFRKKRKDRKNSHLHEWKSDVMAYLENLQLSDTPMIQTTKKALREVLSIPERSLDKVLKVLKAEGKILLTVKAGRGGGIKLASIKAIFLSLIQLKKDTQEAYMARLADVLEQPVKTLQTALKRAQNTFNKGIQLTLFEQDIG